MTGIRENYSFKKIEVFFLYLSQRENIKDIDNTFYSINKKLPNHMRYLDKEQNINLITVTRQML